MASAFSHAVAALSMGACFCRSGTPKRVWLTGTVCSVIPDFDVIGFRFGIRYGDFWGHRGYRYFLPGRPIHVSPIRVGRFFSERGFAVLQSELVWIWLPAALLALSVWLMRPRAVPST